MERPEDGCDVLGEEERGGIGRVEVVEDDEEGGGLGSAGEPVGDLLEQVEPRSQVAGLTPGRTDGRTAAVPDAVVTARRTCCHGQNAGAPGRPPAAQATVNPSARACSASAIARRVLPAPAGPVSSTSRPDPPATARSASMRAR